MHSSIYLGADGFWHGRVWMGSRPDGKPDRRHVMSKDEAKVRKKVRVLERDRDSGKAAKAGRAPTVQEWIMTYLDTIAVRSLAPRTLDDYWSKARNWIFPHIGAHRLNRLQPEHLDALYVRMIQAGKAESHALKVHRIISRALEIAVRRGKVGRNVAKLVDAPSASRPEIQPFSQEDARLILKTALNWPTGVRWSVGLALGLRQGEVLGLRWECLDLENRVARIYRQLQRNKWKHGCDDPHACGRRLHKTNPCPPNCTTHATYKRGCPKPCPPGCTGHASRCPHRRGGGLVFRPPKGKSRRIVPVPVELIGILVKHRAKQLQDREFAGTEWRDLDLVFCQVNGTPVDPRDDWEDWKALLRAAGVRDARVHDGRHTAGTLLMEQGVDLRVIQEIFGHSDSRVTEIYTHVGSRLAHDAAARMSRALWAPSETTTETTRGQE